MGYFHVDRVQYPIGQGGFHAMSLHGFHGRFSVVVDCGGDTAAHRKGLIDAFAMGDKDHDALVISHLDWDHIGGIRALAAAGVRFANVFLPHVDEEEYARWMTLRMAYAEGEAEAGEETGVIAQAVNSLAGLYGGRYGRPVRVVRDGDNPPLEPGLRDDGDRYPPVSDLLSGEQQALLAAYRPEHTFSADRSISFPSLDWLLRFYSWEWACGPKVKAIWRLDVLKPLASALSHLVQGGGAPDDVQRIDALTQALDAPVAAADATRALREIGDKGVAAVRRALSVKALLGRLYALVPGMKGYNDASLSVYSGPSLRGRDVPREWFERAIERRRGALHPEGANAVCRAVGWLHMGDASLDGAEKLEHFVLHYQVELPLTSVLVLPHHGSRHSYGRALDEFDCLSRAMAAEPLFVATAQPERRYGHPHAPVAARCHVHGALHIVDRQPASILQETVRVYRPAYRCCCMGDLV